MTSGSTTVADLRLRGSDGAVDARLHLPVTGPGPARLLILLPAPAIGDIALADRLSRCPFRPVVLVVHCRTPPDALSSVEWRPTMQPISEPPTARSP